MLTFSLHAIKIHAKKGLYPEELMIGNSFEMDIDITVADKDKETFIDYTIVHQLAVDTFHASGHTLEGLAIDIHDRLKQAFATAQEVKVSLRKLNPPMPGAVGYAQVIYQTEQK